MSATNLEVRCTLGDEIRSLDHGYGGLFDLGHPLLNRIADSFVKAAGIGAVQAVAREAYFTAVEGASRDTPPEIGGAKNHHAFPSVLKGGNNKSSVEALIKNTGKESMQWGFAAGVYSGLTYGLREARGVHDWRNSALAGAITGAALAMTTKDHSHDHVIQCAITGAAISTAANLLTGIF
ncbi:PREDICTED: outer envelope pore protein 16-2, chloroplastic-like [Ipomoea nil]|uniref:outer envelope pore protein 16-2, chloroplastic-like n=1 Tax=Ipomoea nil TaxID=35883 RepID=UPI000901A253|nr:PREDICTED: outer envelope pore protein 16-2, chloroplastic-like [Ipomoea nil]